MNFSAQGPSPGVISRGVEKNLMFELVLEVIRLLSAVPDVHIYRVVSENPPVFLTEFNYVLRSRALEADHKSVKEASKVLTPESIAYKAELKRLIRKEATISVVSQEMLAETEPKLWNSEVFVLCCRYVYLDMYASYA